MYIGDTVDDINAANKADIDSIGIIPPVPSEKIKELFENKGVKVVLNNINKLNEVLK